jgi:hypothetical protein
MLFLLSTAFMQLPSAYGSGQNIADLMLDNAVKAVRTEMIEQIFAVLGLRPGVTPREQIPV